MLILSPKYTCACVIGDDWEHEEIFTDDDEAVGNDPEEREDLAPEVPAPPEIKQVSFSKYFLTEKLNIMLCEGNVLPRHYKSLLLFQLLP